MNTTSLSPIVLYALVAALSPTAFAATLALIRSGRLKALGFASGVVVGQLLACSILVLVGTQFAPYRGANHATWRAVLELGLGLVLLPLALAVYRRPESASQRSNARSQAVIARLGHIRVVTAVGAGLLLGIGGPKRLVLTALASASITSAGDRDITQAALVGWYSLVATALVWAPVLAFALVGDRTVAALDAAQRWLSSRQRLVVSCSLAVLGVLLVVDGILRLQ